MSKKNFLFQKKEFDGWKTLNDTVMGGSSSAFCETSNSGLILKGNICLLYTSDAADEP